LDGEDETAEGERKTTMIKNWNVSADRNISLGTRFRKDISNPCCDVFVCNVRYYPKKEAI